MRNVAVSVLLCAALGFLTSCSRDLDNRLNELRASPAAHVMPREARLVTEGTSTCDSAVNEHALWRSFEVNGSLARALEDADAQLRRLGWKPTSEEKGLGSHPRRLFYDLTIDGWTAEAALQEVTPPFRVKDGEARGRIDMEIELSAPTVEDCLAF
jgi:hypothetical protein